jgi:hypothetical protein
MLEVAASRLYGRRPLRSSGALTPAHPPAPASLDRPPPPARPRPARHRRAFLCFLCVLATFRYFIYNMCFMNIMFPMCFRYMLCIFCELCIICLCVLDILCGLWSIRSILRYCSHVVLTFISIVPCRHHAQCNIPQQQTAHQALSLHPNVPAWSMVGL